MDASNRTDHNCSDTLFLNFAYSNIHVRNLAFSDINVMEFRLLFSV